MKNVAQEKSNNPPDLGISVGEEVQTDENMG
jgi:hypothetical protein